MTNVVAAREGDDAGKPPRALLNVEGGSPQGTGRRPYVVLCACVLLYLNNQWARQLPSYLVNFNALDPATAGAGSSSAHELINVALGFDAKQYGLLVSYGFTVLYVLCSFPAGALCDVFSRKAILLVHKLLGFQLSAKKSLPPRLNEMGVEKPLADIGSGAYSGIALGVDFDWATSAEEKRAGILAKTGYRHPQKQPKPLQDPSRLHFQRF